MYRVRPILLILVLSMSLMISTTPQPIGGQAEGLNWIDNGYDHHHTGFSPQTVINKDNVKDLELKWVYQLPANPYRNILQPSFGIETNPLVVNGILYFASSYSKLFAINTFTGFEIWTHEINVTAAVEKPWIGNFGLQHSVSYRDGVIYQTTMDCTVYGFEATTGAVKLEIPDICKDIPGNKGQYFGEEAPVIYKKDGRMIGIVAAASGLYYARGFISAYDLDTKKLLWRWFSVPPQEEGPKDNWEGYKDVNKGNIKPYPGDWGTTGEIFGGSIWSANVIDEETGTLYLSTGYPGAGLTLMGRMDTSLTPGPNLYTNSIVALDVETGEMKWYYQATPHDIIGHGFGWNVVLANAVVDGSPRKVIVIAGKDGYVHELDAETGKPVFPAVKLGLHLNNHNAEKGNDADMTLNQKDGEVLCPGGNGGVESPVAFVHNTIFAASQNRCFQSKAVENAYKGYRLWVHGLASHLPQNSTLYAIDASTGGIKWRFDMPNTYQGAGVVVSGGVVYAVDRVGTLYMLEEDTGKLLRSIYFGGLGAAGVSIGANIRGEMMLFVVTGGGEIVTPTAGTVSAFALRQSSSGSSGGDASFWQQIAYVSIAVAAVMVLVNIYTVITLRGRAVKAK